MFLDLYEHLVEGEKPNPDDIFKSASQSEWESMVDPILLEIIKEFGGQLSNHVLLHIANLPGGQTFSQQLNDFLQKRGWVQRKYDTSQWDRVDKNGRATLNFYGHGQFGALYYHGPYQDE